MIKIPEGKSAEKALERLSPRHQDIINELKKGFSAIEVAAKYDISSTQITNIVKKYKRLIEKEEDNYDDNHIYRLNLSTRSYNALLRREITTIDQLVEVFKDPDEVAKIRNLGPTGYNDIVDKLKQYGYELNKMEIKEIKKFFTVFSTPQDHKIILFVKAYNINEAKEIAEKYMYENKNTNGTVMDTVPVEIKEDMYITAKDIKGEK